MESFLSSIKEACKNFSKITSPIRIISHLDADGLSAASIMTKTLSNIDKQFILSVVRQVSPQLLKELKNEKYDTYLFLDLGSGNLKEIDSFLKNKAIYILDHHIPQNHPTNFSHLNPHLHNINGSRDISGAGVAYLFSKCLKENISLSHLALVGAIGDTQEDKDGFAGINKEIILKDALESGNLEVKLGLRMFGAQTRPLYKILQFSTDPYIPGITGDEEASISFLAQINIDKDRKLIDLSEDEMKKLVAAIIIKRMGSETNPEDVLGNTYLLKDQPESSPTKDLKEFATLLNSCGRMHKPSLGIGTCLNDPESYENAVKLLVEYKQKLIDSLNWFHKNKDSSLVIETPELVLINAEENIPDTLIGTVTSMISKSNIYKEGTVLISLAHTLDSNTKISIRISGYKIPEGIDLKEVLDKITQKLGYPAGGHSFAAGSLIPQEKEKEFIDQALETFKNQSKTIISN